MTQLLLEEKKISSIQQRSLSLSALKELEPGEIEFSLSSEEPYTRWFATEVLRHSAESVNLERLNSGSAALLFNHNRDDYLGIIKRGWLENGLLRVVAKFELDNEHNELALKVYNSVLNGTLRSVSVGYEYNEIEFESRDGIEYLIATRWTPFEGSIVTVPADATVGIGREVLNNDSNRELSKKDYLDADIAMAQVEAQTIDKEQLIKEERDRTESILAAGKHYNCPDLARQAVSEGWSLTELRSRILDDRSTNSTPVSKALVATDLTKKERKRYSFNRAIAYAAGKVGADAAGLELEVSRNIEQRIGKPPVGIYVDQSFLVDNQRATYDTGIPEAAGVLIETELLSDRFIEALYNESAFLPLGVTYLRDLQGNIEIPREGTYQKGYWVEEQAVIPQEEGSFNKIALSPKKLAVRSKMTYEMMTQSSIDLENLTRNRLIRGLALELDRSIGFGNGIGEEPLGILSHPEVKSIVLGTNGGSLDWASVVAMQTEIDEANAMSGGNFSYVVNSRTKGKLMTTLDQSSGSGNWIWQMNGNGDEGMIAGYRARCSNQIPNNLVKGTATNLSAAFFGNFANVLLGLWTGLDIAIDPYTDFDRAIVGIRAMQLVDFNLTRGESFCCCADVQNN